MRVRLVDVDSKIPNVCLMKLVHGDPLHEDNDAFREVKAFIDTLHSLGIEV